MAKTTAAPPASPVEEPKPDALAPDGVSVATQLLETLQKADEATLTAIETQIAAKQKEIDSLQTMAKLIRVKLHGKPKSGPRGGGRKGSGTAATAAGGSAAPVASTGPRGSLTYKYRRDAALYLKDRGPQKRMVLVQECDIPAGSITAVLNYHWFKQNPDTSMVELTPAGRTLSEDD